MAQVITDFDLLQSQARIAQAYSGETPSKYPFFEPAMSAAALLRNNNSFGQGVFGEDGKFRAFEINWLKKGASTVVQNTTPAAGTQSCTLSNTVGATSEKKQYTNNMLITAEVEVDDNVYGNGFDVGEIIDNRIMAAMRDIRNAFNTKVINFLNTNRTPANHDDNLPDGITFNDTDDRFEVDLTTISMQDPDNLTEIEALALNNNIQNSMMLTGRYNFYSNIVNAQYRQLNDNERYLGRYFDPAYNIYTDPRSLDATLTGKNTFVVGEGTYAVWDYVHPGKTNVPRQIEDNKWEYVVNDPVLLINQGGVLRPLRYNIFYTRECNSVNKTVGNRTFLHKWEVSLLGGLVEAPVSETDSHTGILKLYGVGV